MKILEARSFQDYLRGTEDIRNAVASCNVADLEMMERG